MGPKTPKEGDRRVQRTRRLLGEALIALTLERGWEGFSVQDVCDRADVGRSTFYLHFADREDLLVGGLDDLRKMLRAESQSKASRGTPLGFARGLIEHAAEQRPLFRAIAGKRSAHTVQQRFREMVLRLVQEDLADRLPATKLASTARFIAGGFMELIIWWLEARSPLPPEELEAMFLAMARPLIAS